MVKPQNTGDIVQEFITLLGLDPDATFTLKQNQGV